MMESIEQQLGNYRIQQLLGHGGFADVYLGEHIYLHTQAAIKVLRTRLAQEDSEHFQREARLIAHLVHPHIVRVLEFGVEKQTPFLVMDYASGGTLRQHFPPGSRHTPDEFMPYVKQIASALQYAHDRQIIHRDIKPENMLLNQRQEVELSDFGIAIVAHSTETQETESTVIGTMTYMAPEQIQGKARPASDQYALAVVIYEWLTGEKPFKGSYMEIVTQHLSAPPPPIDEHALALPHAFTQVLWRALAKDHHARFARIQDFADALEQACHPGAAYAPGASAPPVYAPQAPHIPQNISQFSAQSTVTPGRPPVEPVKATPYTSTEANIAAPVRPAQPGFQPITRRSKGCARPLILTLIAIPLLLCAFSIAGYAYLENRNPPSQAASLSQDFMTALVNRSYDQAYNDLGSSITDGTSQDSFVQQAQSEDSCAGPITSYRQTSTSTPNNNQVYYYQVSRAKLAQPYQLYVTVSKDFFGNWHITDYNSDIPASQGCSQ